MLEHLLDALNALRIGFIVVPERLVEAFRIARAFIDRPCSTVRSGRADGIINEGHFGTTLERCGSLLGSFAATYRRSNRRLFRFARCAARAIWERTVAWIKTRVPEMVLTQRAEQLGLEVVPISHMSASTSRSPR